MFRTRVKICGITRADDALAAARAGADAIGLVFYGPSPRAVTAEQAAAICAVLPPFVTTVGLFVDATEAEVAAVLSRVPLDLLQFHGDETPEYCRRFDTPWIKALAMRDGLDVAACATRYAGARGLLLDAWVPGVPGGTGEVFDWARIPDALPMPVVLAGGLTPDNVAQAIARVQPWAVDVSGGVEARDASGDALRGIKSAEAMKAFIQQVQLRGVEGG
ncbi:MAG: phosphoribosylanthranilate isomerase [Alcanivorax sp.]|nr:phosphoribosylanthranilate isomerase [Alcanivorax sp.]